jgi:hypothetical protein
MTASYQQVVWDFPAPTTSLRRRVLRLRTLHDEDELFDRSTASRDEGVEISLPMPFLETALMDPTGGSWQERPLAAKEAADLGARMWTNLPLSAQAELASPGVPTLLKINITGSGVDDVPWEWLHLAPASAVALQPNVRLARNVPVLSAPPPFTVAFPLRLLIVATNPKMAYGEYLSQAG